MQPVVHMTALENLPLIGIEPKPAAGAAAVDGKMDAMPHLMTAKKPPAVGTTRSFSDIRSLFKSDIGPGDLLRALRARFQDKELRWSMHFKSHLENAKKGPAGHTAIATLPRMFVLWHHFSVGAN